MPFPVRRSLEIVSRVCCMLSCFRRFRLGPTYPCPPVFLIFLSELLSLCVRTFPFLFPLLTHLLNSCPFLTSSFPRSICLESLRPLLLLLVPHRVRTLLCAVAAPHQCLCYSTHHIVLGLCGGWVGAFLPLDCQLLFPWHLVGIHLHYLCVL